MKHTTITDIAKKLGLSPSTVSRALNDHPDIKTSTKKLVKKTAKEYNFKPNPIAQSLKNNKTTIIGVIVPEIKHDFFSSAISGIEEVSYQSGYTIIVCQSNESFEREVVNTNSLIQQRVAGIIASISQNTKDSKHFHAVLERGIPLVFFDRVCKDIVTSKVIIDDKKSAFSAVMHLAGRGYKKIAHFAGPKVLEICKLRLLGYTEALKKAKLPLIKEFIQYGGLDEKDGYNSMDYLLKRNLLPDAIFAVNDPVAIGAFQRIKEAGLKIPSDIGIVGFSNNKITSLVDPPITTLNQPSFDMGKKAAEMLIEIIEDEKKTIKAKTVVLDAELIIRGST
jgi:DNA-binding LacI/PurR family transcriptional regulator